MEETLEGIEEVLEVAVVETRRVDGVEPIQVVVTYRLAGDIMLFRWKSLTVSMPRL